MCGTFFAIVRSRRLDRVIGKLHNNLRLGFIEPRLSTEKKYLFWPPLIWPPLI